MEQEHNEQTLAKQLADKLRVSHSSRPVPLTGSIYYDKATKYYYMLAPSEDYIPVSRSDLAGQLVSSGMDPKIPKGGWLSPVEEYILKLQRDNHVDFVGALAGHSRGFLDMGGTRCLIITQPTFIKPAPGDWSMLRGVLERMFGATQWKHVLGWIKVALDMFHGRLWHAGQALVICGPAGAGKNLFGLILQQLFGGRMPGKPYKFMTGRTDFNADFFASELLTIEDEAESTSIQARRAFGSAIKMMTVNQVQWLHPKGKTALSVTVLQRLLVSLNNDPERLLVLPPIEPDIEDKIILLRVEKHPMPMETSTPAGMAAFWSALTAQLPAFVHFLHEWQVPLDMREPRFGVRHYHHPELLASLHVLSPEQRLLELIDDFVFSPVCLDGSWTGRSTAMDRLLKSHRDSRCAREAEKLLPSLMSCGKYLGRLERLYPRRVSQRTLNGNVEWTVLAPTAANGRASDPTVSLALMERLRAARAARNDEGAAS